jgi:phosphatidylglycerol:prolipoprotein diacylglycerol transferase
MVPYLHIFGFALPTFGLMLWLASVAAAVLLHMNFQRHRIVADALTIVAVATIAGVLGAKLWHELEHPLELWLALSAIAGELRHSPATGLSDLLDWAKTGFAWFGGLAAGIAALLVQARMNKIKPLTMLDLAAPSAAVGYGIGRIGCHLSGDGDYGIATNLPWGVSYQHGIVPTPPGVRVHPTPIYECAFSLLLALYLWKRGGRGLPAGRMVGEYLFLAGLGRFAVEFIRINPKVFLGMTNAQVASVGSMLAGVALVLWSMRKPVSEGHGFSLAARPQK